MTRPLSQEPEYLPTLEEIAIRAGFQRMGWSQTEYERRRRGGPWPNRVIDASAADRRVEQQREHARRLYRRRKAGRKSALMPAMEGGAR